MRNGNVTVIAGLVSGAIVMLVLFQTVLPALAQGGGSYELRWSTIDGGGRRVKY